jgi:hypothetical protein
VREMKKLIAVGILSGVLVVSSVIGGTQKAHANPGDWWIVSISYVWKSGYQQRPIGMYIGPYDTQETCERELTEYGTAALPGWGPNHCIIDTWNR